MAAIRNLTIDQGTSWFHSFRVRVDGADLDENWTGLAQVRRTVSDATKLFEFDVTIAESVVTLAVEPVESSLWTWREGVYDLEIEHTSGRVLRVVQGSVKVSPEVTR